MIPHFPEHQIRDISSSEDNCKCSACRNQEDFKLFNRKNICNMYLYKHLKKRQGPPTKKDTFVKDVSQKAKFLQKKQETDKKVEADVKKDATPVKHKLADRSKEAANYATVIDYHPVSHSQRLKLTKGDLLLQIMNEGGIRREEREGRNRQIKSNYELINVKLAEISENPEKIRMRNQSSSNRSSSHHQASPPCFEQRKRVSEEHRN